MNLSTGVGFGFGLAPAPGRVRVRHRARYSVSTVSLFASASALGPLTRCVDENHGTENQVATLSTLSRVPRKRACGSRCLGEERRSAVGSAMNGCTMQMQIQKRLLPDWDGSSPAGCIERRESKVLRSPVRRICASRLSYSVSVGPVSRKESWPVDARRSRELTLALTLLSLAWTPTDSLISAVVVVAVVGSS